MDYEELFESIMNELTDRPDLREKIEKIKKLVTCDILTGLEMWCTLDRRLKEAVELADRTGPFSYFVFDIAGLKYINDNYNYNTGSDLIRHGASFLRKNTRPMDHLLKSKDHGDEFVLIMSIADNLKAGKVKERLIEEMKDYPFVFDGGKIPLLMAIGYSTYPNTEVDLLHKVAYEEMNKDKKRIKELYPELVRN